MLPQRVNMYPQKRQHSVKFYNNFRLTNMIPTAQLAVVMFRATLYRVKK